MSSTGRDEFRLTDDSRPDGGTIGDRILYWPIVLTVVWPIALILVWVGPFNLAFFLGAPLVLLLWAGSAVDALVRCAISAHGRAWRRVLSTAILPLSGVIACLNYGFVLGTTQYQGTYLRFLAMRPFYLREISKLPADEPRLKLFYWGGFLLTSHEILYDESDEIVLPEDERSEAWSRRAAQTDAGDCPLLGYSTLGNHFYLVTFHC